MPTFPYDFERAPTLLVAARAHVLQRWNEQHDPRLVYHHFAQAAGVARLVEGIARAEGLPADVAGVAQLAAWFHNLGYLYDQFEVAEAGAIQAEFFLTDQQGAPDLKLRVRQCIVSALNEAFPRTADAQLLSDAIQAYDWVDTYEKRAPLLRFERELLGEAVVSDAEWREYLRHRLQQCRFYTAYAKAVYEPVLAEHLLALRVQPAAPAPKSAAAPARFERIPRRSLRAGVQTFFRTNYANHMHLSAIADNKAHIMISVNAILLSVAISLLTYQSLINRNPLFILPIIVFLVTSLASLIFAVLSSRPRVTSVPPLPEHRPNPVFFGNFIQLSPEQYEAAVDEMLRDGRLLFGNMARDLYALGHVLDKKYRMLMFSYTIFMMGFVVTVVGFLAVFFMTS